MLRVSRREVLVGALAAGAGMAAASSTACRLVSSGPRPYGDIAVGAVGIFPSPGEKFEGEIPESALKSAVAKLNAGGGILGRRVIFRGAQAGSEDEAYDGYRRLEADPSVVGVILATPLAADHIIDDAASRGMPLIVTATDLYSSGGLWPTAREKRSIFQFAIPDAWAMDVIADYCRNDREYKRAALVYDDFSYPQAADQFRSACSKVGLEAARVEQFGRNALEIDEQIASFRSSNTSALFVWADPQATAKVAIALSKADASFSDAPAARTPEKTGWRPQMFGSTLGMIERDWATVAGSSATVGSIAAGDVGSFRKGPDWPPEDWGSELAADWAKKEHARRGVRPVVDSTYAFAAAVQKMASTDRAKVIEGLESGRDLKFASTEFGFTPENHLAYLEGDLALYTLERSSPVSTSPPYTLGREWRDGTATDPDMTLLVRPRLAANRALHAEYVDSIVNGGYGTQCTREPNGNLSSACKVH